MNNRVLFMIIGNEVKYLQNSNQDHREWYLSLGLDANLFDSIVRGYVIDIFPIDNNDAIKIVKQNYLF